MEHFFQALFLLAFVAMGVTVLYYKGQSELKQELYLKLLEEHLEVLNSLTPPILHQIREQQEIEREQQEIEKVRNVPMVDLDKYRSIIKKEDKITLLNRLHYKGRINTKEGYDKLLATGMFYEFYPELSGVWEKDKEVLQTHQTAFYLTKELTPVLEKAVREAEEEIARG